MQEAADAAKAEFDEMMTAAARKKKEKSTKNNEVSESDKIGEFERGQSLRRDSTTRSNAAQYSTTACSTAYSTAYSTAPQRTAQHTAQHSKTQQSTAQYSIGNGMEGKGLTYVSSYFFFRNW